MNNNYNIIIRYSWDESKNVSNQKKHHVSFEEAVTVFDRDDSIIFDDPIHSLDEDRYLIIGITNEARLCVVSWCERAQNFIRIISAREATKSEADYFREFNRR